MKTTGRVILTLMILGVGIFGMRYLIKHKPKPGKKVAQAMATPVNVIRVQPVNHPVRITGMGQVEAARQVRVQPQVSGKIVWVSPKLVPGGILKQGDVICRIEATDYKALVAQRQAAVEKAKYDLLAEKGRAAVAKREWEMLKHRADTSPEGRALALRKPQLAMAAAALKSAKSALATARLNVDRTVLRAPFDALVLTKSVDKGQVVGPGAVVATLVEKNAFWVRVSIPTWELAWFDLPGSGHQGAVATIFQQDTDGGSLRRTGRVLNVIGQLDPKGRMAQVLIEVGNPLEINDKIPVPLLLGAYVKVEIRGRTMNNVFRLPQQALRQGDRVYVMDAQARLSIRKVQVLRMENDSVLIRGGLKPDEQVVTSRLETAVAGMKLKAVNTEPDNE